MMLEPSHRTAPEIMFRTMVQTRQENSRRGMIMQARKLGRPAVRLAALAATAVLALTGAVAMAQPGFGHGAGHPHGGPGGMEIEHVLGAVKGQLNLNTSQQVMWDNAVAQTKSAHETGRANMQKVHAAMKAELAKPEPDLAAVSAVADSTQASNQALRQDVRKLWLQVYATFSPEQKAVVRDALAKQVARMEAMGAKMREHMQRGS
jgi:Spy/CpxP family protein refolding chaperone